MSLRRILAMTRKEVIQIRRDPRSLMIIIAMPLIQLFIFGYAVNLDIRHIPLCVYDRDATQTSQDLLKRFQATDYFDIVRVARKLPGRSPQHRLWRLYGGRGGSAAIRGNPALRRPGERPGAARRQRQQHGQHRHGLCAQHRAGLLSSRCRSNGSKRHGMAAAAPAVTFQPRTWFNEDLESMANIVPGVVALVMAVVGAFLTSLTIAREWERGTMEQLISTPVGKLEIQIGKLGPYFVIGMMDTALCAGMGVWWFGVPFRGSWALMFGCSMLFLIVVLSLGYLISVIAKSQLAASQWPCSPRSCPPFCCRASYFPLNRCRVVVQWITRILPARYYVSILRNVFLKGTAARLDGGTVAALAIIAVVLITLATRAFQKRLE